MKNPSDKKLWNHFKNGSEDALSHLYEQNVDFLFSYGNKFTKDEALILDEIQDLFVYLISKRKTLGETDNIRFYLLKSFKRRLLKVLKRKVHVLDINENALDGSVVVFSKFEEIILDEEKYEMSLNLKRALSKLSSQQQEVLYYKFTCGLDYRQIGEMMSISYASSRQIFSRSIQTLKKYLKSGTGVISVLFSILN